MEKMTSHFDHVGTKLVGEGEESKKKGRKNKKLEREALPSLYILRRSNRRFPTRQKEKFFLTT